MSSKWQNWNLKISFSDSKGRSYEAIEIILVAQTRDIAENRSDSL